MNTTVPETRCPDWCEDKDGQHMSDGLHRKYWRTLLLPNTGRGRALGVNVTSRGGLDATYCELAVTIDWRDSNGEVMVSLTWAQAEQVATWMNDARERFA